jgi:hypothetical protein
MRRLEGRRDVVIGVRQAAQILSGSAPAEDKPIGLRWNDPRQGSRRRRARGSGRYAPLAFGVVSYGVLGSPGDEASSIQPASNKPCLESLSCDAGRCRESTTVCLGPVRAT